MIYWRKKHIVGKTLFCFLMLLSLCMGCLFLNVPLFNDSETKSKWFYFYTITFLCSIITVLSVKNKSKLVLFDFWLLGVLLFVVIHTLCKGCFSARFVLTLSSSLCLYAIFRLNPEKEKQKMFYAALTLSGLLLTIYGIGQHLGLFQRINGFKVSGRFDNPAGFASALAFILPFCLYFASSQNRIIKYSAYFIYVIILLGIILSESRAGIITALIVSCLYMLNQYKDFIAKQQLWKKTALLLLLLTLSGSSYFLKKDSADGRLLIWHCTWNMIKEKPLFGGGNNAFEAGYMLTQADYFKQNPDSRFAPLADNVKHPFNEILLWIVSFGFVGFVLLLLVGLSLFLLHRKNENRESFTALNTLVGVLIFSCFSYPFNYPFTWLVVCVCSAIIAANQTEVLHYRKRNLILPKLVCCTFLIGLLFYTAKQIRNEYQWHRIAHQSLLGETKKMLPEYEALYPAMNMQALFLYNYAAELNFVEEFEKSQFVLAECETLFNDYDVQMLFGYNYMGTGNYTDAESHFRTASYMCPNRFMPLYQLSLIFQETNKHTELNELATLIVNKPVKVPSSTIYSIKAKMKKILEEKNGV